MLSCFIRRALLAMLLLPWLAYGGAEKPSLSIALAHTETITIRHRQSAKAVTITRSDLRKKLTEELSSLDVHAWKQKTVIKHGGCGYDVLFAGSNGAVLMNFVVYYSKVFAAPSGTTHNPQFFTRVTPTELLALRGQLALLPARPACRNDA